MDQQLNIVVTVQGASSASSEIKSVSASVEQTGKQTEETTKQTSNLRKTLGNLATGFAVYKGAQFIKGAVTETANLAKATAGLSRITGMDNQTAAGWVGVAEERGVQSKQLNQSFISLSKSIEGVGKGSKPAIAAFQQLGIGTAGLQQMKPDQVLNTISDAFAKMPNGAEKAALAQQLFGRQAQAILPLINQGSGALNEQVGAMSKHLGMTNETVQSSMKLVQTQREWNASVTGLKVAIATALLPILVQLSQIFIPIVSGFASLMQHSGAFRVIVVALTAALVVFIATMKLAQLADIAFMATAAPWLAVAVAIGVAFVLLYQKCGWFRNAVQALGSAAVTAFNAIKSGAVAVFNWVKGNWPLLVSILGGPIAAAAVQVIKHWGDIKNAATTAFNAIKSAVSAVGSAITSTIGAAFKAVSDAIQAVVNGIKDIGKAISSLPSKALGVITGAASGVGGAIASLNPFGQTGLYASQAGNAIVGENGPEMVKLPQGAQVSPFIGGGLRGGSGGGVIQVPVFLDGRQIALAMGSFTADQQAAR